jgi:hypothetical protein
MTKYFAHEREFIEELTKLCQLDYIRVYDAYQRYRFNIEQSGFIGQEKQ